MAVEDWQLERLKLYAQEIGRDGILPDPTDTEIVSAALDMAESNPLMRTQDEFNAVITFDDLPAPEDHRDIVGAWEKGNAEYEDNLVAGPLD